MTKLNLDDERGKYFSFVGDSGSGSARADIHVAAQLRRDGRCPTLRGIGSGHRWDLLRDDRREAASAALARFSISPPGGTLTSLHIILVGGGMEPRRA